MPLSVRPPGLGEGLGGDGGDGCGGGGETEVVEGFEGDVVVDPTPPGVHPECLG